MEKKTRFTRWIIAAIIPAITLALILLAGCGNAADQSGSTAGNDANDITSTIETGDTDMTLHLSVDGTEIPVTWQENESVAALQALAETGPVEIPLEMYGGFEQVGDLGQSLPTGDKQTTTSSGDIMLYSGSSIVLFYGSNSWSYTRLGKIDMDQGDLSELLGSGNVTITLWME